jgi:sphingomyelin phosphodiesterase 2
MFFRGLKAVSKHRSQRIHAITHELAASDYDLICLQEVWVHADYEYIRSQVSKSLPYAKYHFSGALGSGLPLFSRWPIISTTIHPYSLNGYPLDVTGGDFYVGKSIVSIVIAHPTLGEVEVFNTHVSHALAIPSSLIAHHCFYL